MAERDLELHQVVIKIAFLNASLDEVVCEQQAPRYAERGDQA